MPIDSVPLGEMIELLRKELESALDQGKERPVRFDVRSVELELNVAISKDAKAGAGLKIFQVVTIEGAGSLRREQTHKFKLTLLPVSPDGGSVLVRDIDR